VDWEPLWSGLRSLGSIRELLGAADLGALSRDAWSAFLGAFLGVVGAVVTVLITDWLRDRRTVRTIGNQIATDRDHAKQKLKTVEAAIRLIRDEANVHPAEIIKFDVKAIREMKAQVLHRLEKKRHKNQALDAVIFRMEGTDSLIAKAQERAERLRDVSENAPIEDIATPMDHIATHWRDAATNLKILIPMADDYLAGKYKTVLTKDYLRSGVGDGEEVPKT
jgi:hypothetical protein